MLGLQGPVQIILFLLKLFILVKNLLTDSFKIRKIGWSQMTIFIYSMEFWFSVTLIIGILKCTVLWNTWEFYQYFNMGIWEKFLLFHVMNIRYHLISRVENICQVRTYYSVNTERPEGHCSLYKIYIFFGKTASKFIMLKIRKGDV